MFFLHPSLRCDGHCHQCGQVEQVQFPNYGVEVVGCLLGRALLFRTLRGGHGEAAGVVVVDMVPFRFNTISVNNAISMGTKGHFHGEKAIEKSTDCDFSRQKGEAKTIRNNDPRKLHCCKS
ncbi:hypothetical protein DEO72_LG4g982 [Vigna unguiculata]|uniref:Uncharacterized protein n=1 Tax=Vigna unguiculata TaxID=3917 RepID=A0A4D6LNC5_VIGUN|nr:hypothetical protein DEO72_LG4g982 [Vigna unguiculata]